MHKIATAIIISFVSLLPSAHTSATDLPSKPERRNFQLSMAFIERLAHCETHSNWKNGGTWSGGLGIYATTWQVWGGTQFAPTPHDATKAQQIIVANRIALWGYTNRKGRFVRPVGLNGWGALPCARPVKLVPRRIGASLAFGRHETTDPYTTSPKGR
jgi:hypothetical protein